MQDEMINWNCGNCDHWKNEPQEISMLQNEGICEAIENSNNLARLTEGNIITQKNFYCVLWRAGKIYNKITQEMKIVNRIL
jgi:hypothetical protein